VTEPALWLNGVDGVTGLPLAGTGRPARLPTLREDGGERSLARWFGRRLAALGARHWGLPFDLDPLDLAQAGWAVVLHEAEPEPVRRALAPLIEHRLAALGPDRVRVLDYRDGESWREWLARHRVEPGSVLPHRVPYYLLLAGNPDRIPFDFQNLLAVEYAVGRLAFDRPEDYARYVASLIGYETAAAVPNCRQAVFFAPRHPDDPATAITADHLAAPLATGRTGVAATPVTLEVIATERPGPLGVAGRQGFASRALLGAAATRANLADVLSPPPDEQPPALLFTASHGVGFPAGHAEQRAAQGALVCQDWAGWGAIRRADYFTADDLPDDARLHGLIAFHFACYSAGTPERDAFLHQPGSPPPVIAPQPFVARLPQRLLGHPRGGALAVVGHVERAWGYSAVGASGEPQRLPFENSLGALLQGWPVGHAVRDFRQRFAALSAALSERLERRGFGADLPEAELCQLWVERNDARNYAVLGDPAARLRVADLAPAAPEGT
jgi:hypothetical protein